ncbi:MAG TPA: alpha/beta fold hydrolase [Propylenella sp.]|nr:alpha/beta fold hydrolase [Propylenella sp.]
MAESGAGPAFVFQHGLCGDAAQTAEVFPDDAPFRRITLECRGHGGSESGDPAAFSIAAFANDVAALIERQALGPSVVGGISMGAAIALRLAVTRPDLVRALVLARPAWVTDPAPVNMRPYLEVGELLSRFPAEEARARFEASATAAWLAREGPDNLASLQSFFSRRPQEITAALLTRISRDGPGVSAADVAALRIPAVVIGHERDPLHPWSSAEQLAALVPGAQLAKIAPKAESRERYVQEFRAALRRFLAELGP